MPPEMLLNKGDASCAAADIWGLGCVLYYLLYLEPAFRDGREKFQTTTGYRPSLGGFPGWDDVISSCWDGEPSKRPNAVEIEKSLQRLAFQWMTMGADGKSPSPSSSSSSSSSSHSTPSLPSSTASAPSEDLVKDKKGGSRLKRSLVRQITYGERDLSTNVRSVGSLSSRRKSPVPSEGIGKKSDLKKDKRSGERKASLKGGPVDNSDSDDDGSSLVMSSRSSCLSDFRGMVNVDTLSDVHFIVGNTAVCCHPFISSSFLSPPLPLSFLSLSFPPIFLIFLSVLSIGGILCALVCVVFPHSLSSRAVVISQGRCRHIHLSPRGIVTFWKSFSVVSLLLRFLWIQWSRSSIFYMGVFSRRHLASPSH
jgi:hypothetical protein